jgi:flagellar biosynthesis protein FlhF
MQVKRYEAASMKEALAKIKNDLGPDAIVISTKRLPGEKKLIEIMAASDEMTDPGEKTSGLAGAALRREAPVGTATSFLGDDRELIGHLRKEMDELKALVQGLRQENLAEDFADLKESLQAFFDILGLRGQSEEKTILTRIYRYLISRGVSQARACKLLEKMRRDSLTPAITDYASGLKIAEGLIRDALNANAAADKVSDKNGQGKRIKVFLGPTGVGKTTTLAKLAARYALEQKRSVGLITMDNYRIAALEQLQVYARIMGLPLEAAAGQDAFRQALQKFDDKDLILVDTPGKSRTDKDYFSTLQELVAGNREVETNLLLSLTSSRENMQEVVLRYHQLDCDRIIFTKMDEGTRCGFLYDVIEQAGRPVSYLTTGQNVPQDIEVANPARLAEMIMWN